MSDNINFETAVAVLLKQKAINKISDSIKYLLTQDAIDFFEQSRTDYENCVEFSQSIIELADDIDILSACSKIVSEKLKKVKITKQNIDFIKSTDEDELFKSKTFEEIRLEYCESEKHKFKFNIPFLDEMYPFGIDGNTFNMFAAPSNTGKTAIMVSLALECAKQNKKVYYCSFEETEHAIQVRFIQNYYGIDYPEFKRRMKLNTDLSEFKKVFSNIELKHFNIAVDVDSYLSYLDKRKFDVVFNDYFQYFTPNEDKESHENYKIFANKIMSWVKKPGNYTPFFTGAQMNRGGYADNDKLLTGTFNTSIDHLGGALGAAQVADNIINIYPFSRPGLPEKSFGLATYCVKARSTAKKAQLIPSAISTENQRLLECQPFTPQIKTPSKKNKPQEESDKSGELYFDELKKEQQKKAEDGDSLLFNNDDTKDATLKMIQNRNKRRRL